MGEGGWISAGFRLVLRRSGDAIARDGTLRSYHKLQRILDGLLRRPLKAKDAELRALILVGLYQLLCADVPHQAALNALAQTVDLTVSADHLLRLKPNKGSFISPAQVEVKDDGHTKRITLTYVYIMPNRISPGDGWIWQSLDEVDLPDSIRQLVHARQQEFG